MPRIKRYQHGGHAILTGCNHDLATTRHFKDGLDIKDRLKIQTQAESAAVRSAMPERGSGAADRLINPVL